MRFIVSPLNLDHAFERALSVLQDHQITGDIHPYTCNACRETGTQFVSTITTIMTNLLSQTVISGTWASAHNLATASPIASAFFNVFIWPFFMALCCYLAATLATVNSYFHGFADGTFILLFDLILVTLLPFSSLPSTAILALSLYGIFYTVYWAGGYNFAYYKRELYAERQQRIQDRSRVHETGVELALLIRDLCHVPQLLAYHFRCLTYWFLKFAAEPLLVPIYYMAWTWRYWGTQTASFWSFWFTPVYPPEGFNQALFFGCRPFLCDFALDRTIFITPWFLHPQSAGEWFPGLDRLRELGVKMDELRPMLATLTTEVDQKLVLQILLFLASAVQCKTPQHLLTTVALTMNGLTEKGLADQAMQLYRRLTESEDTSTVDASSLHTEAWDDIRNVVEGWADARNSELVGRIEKAMHLMVHVGLAARLGFDVDETEVARSYEATKKMQSTPDILLFLAQSIIHVGDVIAHYCSDQGSWRSLFRTSGAAKEVDHLYTTVISRQEMYFNGGMGKIGSSEQEYIQQVERCLRELTLLHSKGSTNPLERRAISDKLVRVTQLDSLIRLRCSEATIRVAPFCVKASGPTSQGKSVAVDEFQAHILRVCDFPTDRSYSVSLNENDKFDSAIKNNTVCVRMDDYPKIVPLYAKTNPVELLMRMLNNERVSAVKAEIDQKGTVFFNNKLLMITTNVATMLSHSYSVAPEAAMRRINVHVHMTVKPEFANEQGHFSPSLYRAAQQELGGKLPDAHLHTVQRYVPANVANQENAVTGDFVPVTYSWPVSFQDAFDYAPTEVLENIGTVKFLRYLGLASKAHFEHQEKLIINNEAHFNATHCDTCLLPSTRCLCKLQPEASETNALPPIRCYKLRTRARACRQAAFDATNVASRTFARGKVAIYYYTAVSMETIYSCHLRVAFACGVMQWLAHTFTAHPIFCAVALSSVLSLLTAPLIFLGHILGLNYLYVWLNCLAWEWFIIYPLLQQVYAFSSLVDGRKFGVRRLLNRIKPLLIFATMLAGSYALYKFTRASDGEEPVDAPVSGPLASVHFEGGASSMDAVRRKPAYHINDIGVRRTPPGLLTTTPEQVLPFVERATAYVTLRLGTRTRTCFGLAYRTNRFLINKHSLYFDEDGEKRLADSMQLVFGPRDEGCNMKRIDLSERDIEPVFGVAGLETDQAIVNLAGGGSRADLTRFMAVRPLEAGTVKRFLQGIEFTKTPEGLSQVLQYPVHAARIRHALANGRFVESLFEDRPDSSPSYMGLCGAPLVTKEGGKCLISGIHFLGGLDNGGESIAFATQVTSTSLLEAEARMLARLPTIGPSLEAPMQLQCFATTEHTFTNKVHFKSVVNDLDLDAEIGVVGDTTLARVRPRTAIVDRPVKNLVLEYCACVEDTHEPPERLRDPAIFTESLHSKVDCTGRIDQEVLTAAFLDIAAEDDMLWKERLTFGPLDNNHILPGIAGVAGMESVKLNTSLGLPWRKKKSTVMVREEEPMEDGTLPITMEPSWWEEFERLDQLARSGVRLGLAFGATPKDELVKKGKRKVRIFCSASFFLGMLIRKYYLWFVALEMEDPLAHEMAVGINPMGLDWTEMANHASAMGKKRALACDFTEFDARMRYQITRATFNFYIRQAEKSKHFADADVRAMCVIAEEVCNAIMDYNGTFVELMQSFPSGHNLTVHTNNRANRLLHRCAYYSGLIYRLRDSGSLTEDDTSDGEEFGTLDARERDGNMVLDFIDPRLRECFEFAGKRLFSDFVHLVCYGDDMCGTVAPNIPWYNSIYIAHYLANYGYGYTNADKQLPTQPYQDWSEIDFLKRKFVWDEAEDRWLAPLAWTSITKPLLMGAPPKASSGIQHLEECANIVGTVPGSGQLGEAYLWGEDRYTEFRDGLQTAMEQAGLLHHFENQRLPTYVEQHCRWRKKFRDGEMEGAFDDEVFNATSLAFESGFGVCLYYDVQGLDTECNERRMTYDEMVAALGRSATRLCVVTPVTRVRISDAYAVVLEAARVDVPRAAQQLIQSGFSQVLVRHRGPVVILVTRARVRVASETVLLVVLRMFGPPVVLLCASNS